MKKLIASLALSASLLITTPAFAYEVKSGDTLGEIAVQHDMTLQELVAMNGQIVDIDMIYPGDQITTEGQAMRSTQLPSPAPSKEVATKVLSNYEKDLLARLVRAEAQSEPYPGKVAVAVVVLNRVAHDSFPDSVTAVVNQPGQFTPVSSGSINKPADADSIRAVEEAVTLKGGAGSLFFYNPDTATNRWLDSKTTTLRIGNHVFKK
jgi:N-acetylmuramoyl-L-alanine amidase